jgi:hypothetical protein
MGPGEQRVKFHALQRVEGEGRKERGSSPGEEDHENDERIPEEIMARPERLDSRRLHSNV